MNFPEFNKVVRSLTLMSICIGLSAAIRSGAILTFLHPRSLLFVKIAWIVIVALTLSDLKMFAQTKGRARFDWRNAAILFPLVLALLVKPTGLSSRIAVQKGVSSQALAMKSDRTGDAAPRPDDSAATIMNQVGLSKENYPCRAGNAPVSAPDTIKEDSMYVKLERIYSNPNAHKGRHIAMTGFVVPDTVLGPNSFFLARMMIACCAADAAPVGFYCLFGSAPAVRENDWVIITGTLDAQTVKLLWNNAPQTLPVFKVATIRKIAAPRKQYVYPAAY